MAVTTMAGSTTPNPSAIHVMSVPDCMVPVRAWLKHPLAIREARGSLHFDVQLFRANNNGVVLPSQPNGQPLQTDLGAERANHIVVVFCPTFLDQTVPPSIRFSICS